MIVQPSYMLRSVAERQFQWTTVGTFSFETRYRQPSLKQFALCSKTLSLRSPPATFSICGILACRTKTGNVG
eukprot:5450263-Amphidinium_carterae.1